MTAGKDTRKRTARTDVSTPHTSRRPPAHGPSKDAGELLAIRLRRVRYRAWHRGTKEMDLMLGPFADAKLESLSAARTGSVRAASRRGRHRPAQVADGPGADARRRRSASSSTDLLAFRRETHDRPARRSHHLQCARRHAAGRAGAAGRGAAEGRRRMLPSARSSSPATVAACSACRRSWSNCCPDTRC